MKASLSNAVYHRLTQLNATNETAQQTYSTLPALTRHLYTFKDSSKEMQ